MAPSSSLSSSAACVSVDGEGEASSSVFTKTYTHFISKGSRKKNTRHSVKIFFFLSHIGTLERRLCAYMTQFFFFSNSHFKPMPPFSLVSFSTQKKETLLTHCARGKKVVNTTRTCHLTDNTCTQTKAYNEWLNLDTHFIRKGEREILNKLK